MNTALATNRMGVPLCLLALALLLCGAAAASQELASSSSKCVSITGGAYEDCNCNCKIDDGDKPLCATFILCEKIWGIPIPIDLETGATYDFTGLRRDKTYYVFEVNPLGYLSSNAIPGRGALKEDDDCIKVCADNCGCYDCNYFLDCKIKPCISVEKTADPIAAPIGTQVTYTYKVCNCGNVPLCDVKVVDDQLGDLTCDFKKANWGSDNLKCHECVIFTEKITVTSETPNPIVNCVRVCGWFLLCKVSDEDCAEVYIPITISGGAIHDFTCDGQLDLIDTPLDGATFTLTDLLGNPVTDIFGNPVGPQVGSTFSFVNLKPGFYIVTETNPPGYTSTNAIPGPNALKLTDDTIQVDAVVHTHFPDNLFLDCFEGPCISVDKRVDPVVALPGSTVTYSFKVCNCGSLSLTGITVKDDVLGDLTPTFIAHNGGSDALDPGACVDFTVDFVVPPNPGLQICNTVTVTGTDPSGVVVDDEAEACVDPPLPPTERRCFLPVTFTKDGWAAFCDPNNPIIPGGMIFNRFSKAFSCFTFAGNPAPNQLIVGGKYTISYTSVTSSLQRLCLLFDQPCSGCGKLNMNLVSPWTLNSSTGGGCLAVETIALLMNVAYNDMRLMPRTPGYDLECFVIAQGLFRGKTVAEVFNIANAILAGDPPCKYGLPNPPAAGCAEMLDILRKISANYEFVDFLTFNDRGYLIPNRPFGQPDPPHCPKVPMTCP